MKITAILSLVLAAAFSVVSCKKPEVATPSTPAAPSAETPAVDEKKVMPAPPIAEPTPVKIDEAPVAIPEPTTEPAPAAPADVAAQEAVFQKTLPLMDSLFVALESSTDVDDAVKNLGALEPEFIAMSKAMKEVGEPDEATAAKFNAELEPLKEGYAQRAQTAVMKLMNFDPATLDPSTIDPAAMQKMQEDGMKLQGAMEGLMGHFTDAWENVGE
jgi:hypothetical protein